MFERPYHELNTFNPLFLEPKQMFKSAIWISILKFHPPQSSMSSLTGLPPHGKVDPCYYINKRPSRACQGIITIFHDTSFLPSPCLKNVDHLSLGRATQNFTFMKTLPKNDAQV